VDPGSLAGIVIGIVGIMLGVIMEGSDPMAMVNIPAILIVVVGTVGASMATGMMKDFTGAMSAGIKAMTGGPKDATGSIAVVVELAERARREGLLALEESSKTLEDPFLRKGIQLAVDGTDPDELREILEAELTAKKHHDKVLSKVWADMGAFSPTMGIIGTVFGLVNVLNNLSEPESLGHMIAAAFIATLWGVFSANVIFLPLGKRVQRLADLEVKQMEMMLEGVLSVQAGANPRTLEQKLSSLAGVHSEAKAAA
jgi:chemotaxis protein MotA